MSTPEVRKQISDYAKRIGKKNMGKMDFDKLLKFRKTANPYGRTIEGSDKWVSFSYTDLREKHIRQMTTTAMVAFLNRKLDEWDVPDDVPVVPVYDFYLDPTAADMPPKIAKVATKETIAKWEANKENMKRRMIVKEFLEHCFQFDPNHHVRSAYQPNLRDDTRRVISSAAGRLAIQEMKKKNPEFAEQMKDFEDLKKLKENKTLKGRNGSTKKVIKTKGKLTDILNTRTADLLQLKTFTKNLCEFSSSKDVPEIVQESCSVVQTWIEDQIGKAKDSKLPSVAINMIPPIDYFGHFTQYYNDNFEQLLDVVGDLYAEKVDLHTAINIYAIHDTSEDAIAFQKKHSKEVITPIINGRSGSWLMLGPWSKNLDKARFYSEKTQIIEEIMDQQKKDNQLGTELMRKRVKKKKKENIAKDGPDDPNFQKWKNDMVPSVAKMGAEDVNARSYADPDCPDDGVQIDIIRISNGGLDTKKASMYVEAEVEEAK